MVFIDMSRSVWQQITYARWDILKRAREVDTHQLQGDQIQSHPFSGDAGHSEPIVFFFDNNGQ